MIEINLVPDVKQELIRAQRTRSAVITVAILIGIVAVAIVTLLAIYVFGVQAVRSGLSDTAIKQGSSKLAGVEDLSKTLTIQNQLTKITTLNSEKNIDSRLFDMLTAIIPPTPNDVQISTLSLDASTSTITLEGQAPNGFSATDVFKKTLGAAKVKFTNDQGDQEVALASNISISNTSYGEDSSGQKVLRFTLSFEYAPDFFAPASKNATVLITNIGNATDSSLGIPSSIFADRATDLTTGAQ